MQKININNVLRVGKNYEVRPLTLVLGNRALEKTGEIDNVFDLNYHILLNGANEFNFTVYKEADGKPCRLWDDIYTLKTVWVKEYDEWFEITVTTDESEYITKKTIVATNLSAAELSQTMLYNIEINTEDEIVNDPKYKPTVFYNPNDTEHSLLHRLLNKNPNYKIGEVDESLWNIQRTFTIDNASVYDTLTSTISEEIDCLFLFDTSQRTINVYDMDTSCNDCGYRSKTYFSVCPKCGSTSVHLPYGDDTTIMVDKMCLGNSLQLSVDKDSIKNVMRVKGGDELMDAAVKSINPNGSNYIYYFNDDTMRDMPESLRNKLTSYNELKKQYDDARYDLDEDLVDAYNNIVKECAYDLDIERYPYLNTYANNYADLIQCKYNVMEFASYIKTSMMPEPSSDGTTAEEECKKLTEESLSPISVEDVKKASKETIDSAVLSMVKAIINTGLFKADVINSSVIIEDDNTKSWKGQIQLTSYVENAEGEKDEAKTGILTLKVNQDISSFIEQKVKRAMAKINTDMATDLYGIKDNDVFKDALKKYGCHMLEVVLNAYDSAIQILVANKCSESGSTMYYLYDKYTQRYKFTEEALNLRSEQLHQVEALDDYINNIIANVNKELDFNKYLGDDLVTFASYRREDTYQNNNYSVTEQTQTNAEVIALASELLLIANEEIVKSGEKQYSISTGLNNLLLMIDENGKRIFEPLLEQNYFCLGNFIRANIDGTIYRMRLSEITISYENLSQLQVTFTDFEANNSVVDRFTEILKNSQNMASSYNAITQQAKLADKVNNTFNQLRQEGLDSAQYNVFSTNSTVVMDDFGLLARNYDDVEDQYSPEQLRINGSNIILTDDDWTTSRMAIGKQNYTINGVAKEVWGVNADTVVAGEIVGGDIYSGNFSDNNEKITGTHFNLNTGSFDLADGKISYSNEDKQLSIKGVNLDWTTTTKPSQSDVIGLDDELSGMKQDLNDYKDTVAKYMKFNPEGLTIGAQNSSFTTVIDESSLSFYQDKQKVSYINDNKLFISNAEVTNTLAFGKFQFVPRIDGGMSLVWKDDIEIDE